MRRRSEEADTLRIAFYSAREFAKLDLPALSSIVLLYLALQPEGTAGFAEVRDECGLSQSQTTRLTWALIEAGLVETSVSVEDRRKSIYRLTSKGRGVIGQVIHAAQAHR